MNVALEEKFLIDIFLHMKSSQSKDADDLVTSSLAMEKESSFNSSLTNTTNTDHDLGDESDDSSRPPSEKPRSPVPFQEFQGENTSLPAILLPPQQTVFKSYSGLFNHFQQNPLLFEAFQDVFCIVSLSNMKY